MADLTTHPRGRDGLAEMLGVEGLALDGDEASARIAVSDRILQPYGLVHGGVLSTLAETLCSWGTDEAVRGAGMAASGQSLDISFIRPITVGHVNAIARPRHRGRTTWVWDVEISDDEGRLCALARMTVAVRPARR